MNLFLIAGFGPTNKTYDDAFHSVAQEQRGTATAPVWRYQGPSGLSVWSAAPVNPDSRLCRTFREGPDAALFFDGVPVLKTPPGTTHPGVTAAALINHLDDVPMGLEGEYVVAVVDKARARIDFYVDPFGGRACFTAMDGGRMLISNSIRLLVRCVGHHALCRDGVASLLAFGQLQGPATLAAGVEKLAGGAHIRFDGQRASTTATVWYGPEQVLSDAKAVRAAGLDFQHLATTLQHHVRAPFDSYESVRLSLTGGLDSRLILALCQPVWPRLAAVTYGDPRSDEVNIAAHVARKCGVVHSNPRFDDRWAVVRDGGWRDAVHRFMIATDGTAPLWQIPSIVLEPDEIEQIPLVLSGTFGTVYKASAQRPAFWPGLATGLLSADQILVRQAKPFQSAMTPAGRRWTQDFFDAFAQRMREAGAREAEVLNLHRCYNLVGGMHSHSRSIHRSHMDVFSPLYHRDAVAATFSLDYLSRRTYAMHRGLWRATVPQLFDEHSSSYIPPEGRLALFMSDLMKQGRRIGKRVLPSPKPQNTNTLPNETDDQMTRLRALLGVYREQILDHDAGSVLWQVADRATTQTLTADIIAGRWVGSPALRLGYSLVTIIDYDGFMAAQQSIPSSAPSRRTTAAG